MVYLIYGNGFEETEAMAPLDCLRRAGIPVTTLGIGGTEITSAHQVVMKADAPIEDADLDAMEMLILPGGLGGVAEIKASAQAEKLIRYAADNGRWLCSICAGPTIPGGMGLLEGKCAVCYPGMEDGMVGPKVQKGSQVVVDGKTVTAEAAGSAMAFGLKLVECLAGREAAEKVAFAVHYHGNF